jgi:prepilin-type N-terminal cleavage/methylation domain-containing protein
MRLPLRHGFSLIEALLAAAVLGVSASFLSLAFHNGQLALSGWERQNTKQQCINWVLDRVDFGAKSIEELEEGGEFRAPDGTRLEWKAEVEASTVLDLFIVHFRIESSASQGSEWTHQGTRVIRHDASWYESSNSVLPVLSRDLLLENKQRRFELLQEERQRL